MQIELSAGPIEVTEQGSGTPLLFLHGLFTDERLWDPVVPLLAQAGFRCITPTLPLGSHRVAMRPDADLSPAGLARIIAELIRALDVAPVTVVSNDTATALTQLLLVEHPDVVARAVLTSGDCYEYFFPPVFRPLTLLPRIPGGLALMGRSVRVRFIRKSPLAFGWLTREGISDELARRWGEPVTTNADIRRDTGAVLRGVNRKVTLAVAERLGSVRCPVLIVWGADDRAFPVRLAHQLVKALPDATLVVVPDSSCYLPIDAPDRLATLITDFAAA
jgi:pimeloyl-ACP methyl ester carboxylesterase